MVWYRKSHFYGEIWSKKGKNHELPILTSQLGSKTNTRGVNDRRYGWGLPVPCARTTRHRLRQIKRSNFREDAYIFRDSSRRTESRHSQIASETHPEEDPPLHHHHSSSSASPPHLIAIDIACNWDLLAIGDLVRIFGIDLSNSIMFSFIDLAIMSEWSSWAAGWGLASQQLCASNYMGILCGDS